MKCPTCGVDVPDDAVFCPSCGTRKQQLESLCPSCQTPVTPGAVFCSNCGKSVANPKPDKAVCPACGSEVKPGAAFCPGCGNKLQAAGQYAPPVPPPAQPYYAAQPVAAPRKKRGWLIPVIIAAVVIVSGIGVYALFGQSIQRSVMGPKAAYLQIEGMALKEQADNAAADIAKYGNKNESLKGGMDLDIQLTPSANNPDIDITTAGILEMLTFRDRFIYDRTAETPRYFNRLDILAYDDMMLSLETLYGEDQLIINLPDLLDKSVLATASEIEQMGGSFGLEAGAIAPMAGLVTGSGALDLGVNESNLKKTFISIVDIMLDHIDSCELEKGATLSAGNVEADYDLYDVTITEDSARAMAIEIFKHLKDDEEFYNLVAGMQASAAAASGETAEVISFDEYQQDLQDAIDEIEADESTEDYTINQLVYVDKDDQIVGRDLAILDGQDNVMFNFVYAQPRDGDDEALYLMIYNEEEDFTWMSEYSYDGDMKTGYAALSNMGMDVMQVEFQDVETVEVNNVERLLGQFQLTLIDPDAMEDTAPTEIYLVTSARDDQLLIDLEMPNTMSLSIGYTALAEEDLVMPSYDSANMVSVSDSQGLEGLITPEVQEKMMEIMAMFESMSAG